MTRGQQQVLAYVRQHFEEHSRTPSLSEIGAHFGYTDIAAWKHVQALIREGHLERDRGSRTLVLPGAIDLTPVSTAALLAELGRREVQRPAGAIS